METIQKLESLFDNFNTIKIEKINSELKLYLKLPLHFSSDAKRYDIILSGKNITELIEVASTLIICR